jgi:hypothetical protein
MAAIATTTTNVRDHSKHLDLHPVMSMEVHGLIFEIEKPVPDVTQTRTLTKLNVLTTKHDNFLIQRLR